MTFLKISIPVYKKDKWDQLEKSGRIEVSSDVDNLSEGYQALGIEIDNLLVELQAQNRLAGELKELESEKFDKIQVLKALTSQIKLATEHYDNLKLFLEKLGIDPDARRLTFDKKFLLQDASMSEVEIAADTNTGAEF